MNKHCQTALILTALTISLSACGTLSPSGESAPDTPGHDVANVTEATRAVDPRPIRYAEFSRDQLTEAIMSELGGQRGHLGEAARRYYNLARETSDTAIIGRAAEFAAAAGQSAAAAELATVWLEREPDNIDAHLIIAYQLLETGQLEAAARQMETVLRLGGRADFTSLSSRAGNQPRAQSLELRDTLLDLKQDYPGESSLYYALSQLLDQQGQAEQARIILEEARERFGDSARTLIIEAQLLQNLGRSDAALDLLARGIEEFPRHRLIRYNYAQLLVQNNQLRDARIQFHELVQQVPDDHETLYSLALLNLELNELDDAAGQLQALLAGGNRVNEARFYMGYLEALRDNPDQALHWYRQVNQRSAAFITTQRQIMQLLISESRFSEAREHTTSAARETPEIEPLLAALEAEALVNDDRLEAASQVLDDTLQRHPENTDLLFARSLLNDQLNNISDVERDLRSILRLQPDDARALNHLGYTLTLHTDRYDEALDLIERAIAIEPDDPAIIDSLGWVQYKLGRTDEALENLRRAYAELRHHEVAAHLGEVLWVTGDEEQAMNIWLEALEETPDSEYLQEALERFAP